MVANGRSRQTAFRYPGFPRIDEVVAHAGWSWRRFRSLNIVGFLILFILAFRGVSGYQADLSEGLSQMMNDCLVDEACGRHLAGTLSNSSHDANATNSHDATSSHVIFIEVQSKFRVNALIWALAEELDIAPNRIRRATASTAFCMTKHSNDHLLRPLFCGDGRKLGLHHQNVPFWCSLSAAVPAGSACRGR